MNRELLATQIETYSNAIVAFAVLQGLAFAYAFGTNPFFNCTIKTVPHLAQGLAWMSVLLLALLVVATLALGRAARQIAGEFRGMVAKIYVGKLVAVIIFGLLPMSLTIAYGVGDHGNKAQSKTCAQGR